MFFEFTYILQWWTIFFIIGIIFLPLVSRLFSVFFDKGYIFSKILGIAIVSYSIFLLGILHIVPFSFATSVLILIFFAILNILFVIRDKNDGLKTFLKTVREHRTIFILEEVLFILCFLTWSYVKSFQPDIHGLEKYMDFGILNSILRSDFFPTKDMWFTPLPINYYYFGHLVTAVLTKLSNIPSNITFNLMIASIFAFTFVGSFSIGANLIYKFKIQNSKFKIILSGLLTGFIVTLSGNLQTIYSFFKNYSGENPVPFWHLPFSMQSFPNAYWYPNATRFIQNTIHEFPLYSFVVSDLHGHVLDIPMVLLTIAILLSRISKSEALNPKSSQMRDRAAAGQYQNPNHQNSKHFENLSFKISNLFRISSLEFRALLLGFLLAVMYTTNAWDGIIYFLFAVLIFLYPLIHSKLFSSSKKLPASGWFLSLVILFFGFFIFSYPFNHFFKPFVSGIGIVCPPEFLVKVGKLGPFIFEEAHCQKSPWWQIFTLYGFFYFWIITFFLFIFKKKNPKSEIINSKQTQNHNNQNSKRFGILNFSNWGLFRSWKLEIKNLTTSDLFVFMLILLSTILIIIPELMYAKDIYPAHYRANTMFKLVYQSFIMLSIASSYIIIRLVTNYKYVYWKLAVFGIGIIGLFLIFIYPYFAIGSFYGNLKVQLGLDGTKYLKNLYPTDYDAISWINKNIKGQPVILEAQGDSYTDFARVSANTGLPTVLGWTVHEWLWRGTYDIPAPRITEVQTLYENPNINTTKELIKNYNIEYIFIGDLEYQKYTNLNEKKFETIGKIIYKNGKTKIYEITL